MSEKKSNLYIVTKIHSTNKWIIKADSLEQAAKYSMHPDAIVTPYIFVKI